MWDAQLGRCYLCREPLNPEKAVIDHDHGCCPENASCSYCRRGLACHACNMLIGLARDDPDRLALIAVNLRAAVTAGLERAVAKPQQEALPMFENVSPIRREVAG
jgi:hypothetical protein